jgi:hypothetical protein
MIIWSTPAGFLGTVTELTTATFVLLANSTNTNISYHLISGNLPSGLSLSTGGILSGTADIVSKNTTYEFVVRATDNIKPTDRTFMVDIKNIGNPAWQTNAGILPIGHLDQHYDTYNKEYINFQLVANPINQPTNTTITYNLINGNLPKGLLLDKTGLISGAIDVNFGTFTGTNSLRQMFTFEVSATDGSSTSTRNFQILVTNPVMFKADSTFLNLSTATLWNDYPYYFSGTLTSSVSFLQPPQFIKGSDLGTVSASTNEIISIGIYNPNPPYGFVYDPNPEIGPITYNLITGTNVTEKLPQGLGFDTITGNIYGFIPYQPAYTIDYTFQIKAIKTDNSTGQQATALNTFTLAVKGDIESTIKWASSSTINSIVAGEVSQLYVLAKDINSTYNIKYKLINGNLPKGLTLNQDGTISGSPEYDTVGTHHFTVQAGDISGLSVISKTFNLTVTAYDNKEYTKIYLRPFLTQSSRDYYSEFISSDVIFPQSWIYRTFDSNFGIQPNIKMFLEFGIEQLPGKIYINGTQSYWFHSTQSNTTVAVDKTRYPEIIYVSPNSTIVIQDTVYIINNVAQDPTHDNLYHITFSGTPEISCASSFIIDCYQGFIYKVIETNFYRRKLYFGDIKVAVAQDIHKNNIYEVVYVDIYDNLINSSNVSISTEITQNNRTLYPASITDMRISLESIILPNNSLIGVDQHNLPTFMNTAQGSGYSPIGYIRVVPICYTLPGQGIKIVDRIKNSGFQFNKIDFEIDRLVVGNGPNNDSYKYLVFQKQSIDDGGLYL